MCPSAHVITEHGSQSEGDDAAAVVRVDIESAVKRENPLLNDTFSLISQDQLW